MPVFNGLGRDNGKTRRNHLSFGFRVPYVRGFTVVIYIHVHTLMGGSILFNAMY